MASVLMTSLLYRPPPAPSSHSPSISSRLRLFHRLSGHADLICLRGDRLIAEGPGYQDWEATHAALKAKRRVAVDKALKGDFRFFRELLNRVDGKVTDQIELTGDAPELTATDPTIVAHIQELLTHGNLRPYHPEYDALKRQLTTDGSDQEPANE